MTMHTSNANSESAQLPLMMEHANLVNMASNATTIAEQSSDMESARPSVDGQIGEKKKKKKAFGDHVLVSMWSTWWNTEILAMIISIACMAVLVWVLARFQNQLSSTWSFWISLNAIVAIAATVIKATLLAAVSACLSQEKWWHFSHKSRKLQDLAAIDYASRGPIGSLWLLLGTSWGFASLGAIITVLCLGTDTFFQQIVGFESENTYTLQDGSATFGYTHSYSSFVNSSVGDNAAKSGIINTNTGLPFFIPMQGAIFRGLYQETWPAIFTCTTNCTWEEDYYTLGFSSTCANVTEKSMATMHCNVTTTPLTENECVITTPGGIQIIALSDIEPEFHDSLFVEAGEYKWDEMAKYNITQHRPNPGPVVNISDLFSVAVWSWDNYEAVGAKNVLLDHPTLSVEECTIGLAIYKYSNVSSTSNNFNVGAIEKIALGNYTNATPVTNDTNLILEWNNTGPGIPDMQASWIDLGIIAEFFKSSAFSGGMSLSDSFANEYAGSFMVFNYGNVSGIMDNIMRSMTDQMRNENTMQLAQGLTSRADVYIRVYWLWLILPLVVQVLGCIVLIMTVVGRKKTKHVPLWKASTLAMLYHSVDEDGSLKTDIKEPRELDTIGRTVRAIIDE
ncbi:hypothetical protein ACHAQJ_006525 [Trichoderma viride]